MNENHLLYNLDKIHTTEMGKDRIKRNLNLYGENVVEYCIHKIKDGDCKITEKGKNWYAETHDCIITVNAHSYTIITARKK